MTDALPVIGATRPLRLGGAVLDNATRERERARGTLGFWRSAAQGFGSAADDVQDRFATLFSEENVISESAIREKAGSRMEQGFDASGIQTEAQLQRAIARFDRDQELAQFDRTGLGNVGLFLGQIPPFIIDPVTLATLPFGGANIARGAAASTFRGFVGQTTVGGLKAGAASIPPEILMQRAQLGRVDAQEVAIGALASLPASLIFAGIGRAFRRPSQSLTPDGPGALRPDIDASIAAANPRIPPQNIPEFVRAAQDPRTPDLATARFARVVDDDTGEIAGRWVDDTFGGYESPNGRGLGAFVRDLMERDADALAFARDLDIDPDLPSVQEFLRRHSEQTFGRARRAQSENSQLFQDLQTLAAAQADRTPVPEGVLPRLRKARVVDDEGNILPEFARVADTADEANAFLLDGPEGIVRREISSARERLFEADADPNADPVQVRQDEATIDALRDRATLLADDEIDLRDFLEAISTAQLAGPGPRAQVPRAQEGPSALTQARAAGRGSQEFDADFETTAAEIRRLGGDPEDVNRIFNEVEQAMETCRASG